MRDGRSRSVACRLTARTGPRLRDVRPLATSTSRSRRSSESVNPSVVQIFTSGLAPAAGVATDQSNLLTTQRASGSGVIVDAEGYIVTNAHVVAGRRASGWRSRRRRRGNRCWRGGAGSSLRA